MNKTEMSPVRRDLVNISLIKSYQTLLDHENSYDTGERVAIEGDGDVISQMERILIDNSKEQSLTEINSLMDEMKRNV